MLSFPKYQKWQKLPFYVKTTMHKRAKSALFGTATKGDTFN